MEKSNGKTGGRDGFARRIAKKSHVSLDILRYTFFESRAIMGRKEKQIKEVEPMQSAIGSRRDFDDTQADTLLQEYRACLEGLLEHEQVQRLEQYTQHHSTSRLQHSINVSYYSFLICYRMGWDYRSAARAGLLHDLFFYDWRVKKFIRSNHAAWHPRIALLNAQKITELNKVERDAIRKHMWPCTLVPPRYIESYVVTLVDKLCAVCECASGGYERTAGRVLRRLRRGYVS